MQEYSYKVKNRKKQIIQSVIYASSIAEAASELEKKGFIILEIKENVSSKTRNSFKAETYMEPDKDMVFSLKEKKEFFNGFYYLYKSGYSLSETFKSIATSSKNKNIKAFCFYTADKIEKGSSLKSAISPHKDTLGLVFSLLLYTGEAAGKLENTLDLIIQNIKKEENTKSMIISSLAYPILILCFAISIFMFFSFFIFPIINASGSSPLCITAILILAVKAVLKIIAVFLVIFCLILYIVKNKTLLQKTTSFFAEHTFFASFIKNYSFLNFFTVLGLANQAGMPFCDALSAANSVIGIKNIKHNLNTALMRILNGCEITTSFSASEVFSDFVLSQIATGEKTGELDKSFSLIAKEYEKALDTSIKAMAKTLEPMMIVFVGIVVCYVAVILYKKLYAGIFI